MKRTPEPELMDDDAQARAYSEADFEEPHAMFVEGLLSAVTLPNEGRILDLGCGPADVLARVALALPERFSYVGVDGSGPMLKYGRERVSKHGVADRVTLVEATLPGVDLKGERFAGVISNSLLHHLHEPDVLWQEVKTHVAPGGFVFIMDLMRPADDATAKRFVDMYAEGEPEVLRRDFYHSLHAAFTVDEVKSQVRAAGLSTLKVVEASDRHLVAAGVMPA